MRPARRQFQPRVASLETRQLLSASTISTVAEFRGSNQAVVSGLVEDARGDFYGSTSNGGEGLGKGDATVFEIPSGSKSVETLASFNGRTGSVISGVTVDPRGDVFGTISGQGGTIGNGSAFEIAAGTKTVTTLASFDHDNGEFPNGVVVDGAGDLFGTAAIGGANGVASAYEVPVGSHTVVPIAGFNGASPAPHGLVMDAQGDLFGTNAGGGKYGFGSIFEIPRGSNTVVPIASFDGYDGAGISKLTIDAQGDLFGTTVDGGSFGGGTAFEYNRSTGTVTNLASFNVLTGTVPDPRVGLVEDAQGNLYGTTETGGANDTGTIFEIANGSATITTLASFKNNSASMVNGLTLDNQGNLYGSVDGQGDTGGTVFKLALPKA